MNLLCGTHRPSARLRINIALRHLRQVQSIFEEGIASPFDAELSRLLDATIVAVSPFDRQGLD
jgi:hypothetical protein